MHAKLDRYRSEVFIVWGTLNVLDVGLGLDLDTTVGKFLVADGLSAVEHLAGSLPVPV